MKNGTRTKLIVAVLAAVLVFNVVGFAQDFGDEVEMEFNFVDAPNGLTEDISVDFNAADESYDVYEDEVAELEAALMAAAEAGQIVAPGKVVTYNGKTYQIKENAKNVAAAMGGFDSRPEIASSGETDTLIVQGEGAASNYNTVDGHDNAGCLELISGTFIWRHNFEQNKLYVYSAWWKATGGFNFQDDQRQLEGAYDPDTGSSHVNEIGRSRDITGGWQQDLCVFKGNASERRFLYVPITGGTVLLDDVYIYEVEVKPSLIIDKSFIEGRSGSSWEEYDYIPEAGKPYNFVISYTINVTEPIPFNGIVAIFKDGKLVEIVQRKIDSRTATLYDGDLTPGKGSMSIPFMIPGEDADDLSKYSCLAYISDPNDPFNIYGAASTTYAALIKGGQK